MLFVLVSVAPSSSIAPTASSQAITSSAVATAATTLSPANYPRRVTFKFTVSNCSSLFNASTKAAFATSLKGKISIAVGIAASSMKKFNVSCGSVIVEYEQTQSANLTAAAAVNAIKTKVQSNALNITINGQLLSADEVSFSAVILAPATAATTTLKPTITAKKGGLGIGAIVGIAIGCVVVVIIILVVVYMVCIRKKTRKDPTVEPNDNILELKGKILDIYRTNISK